MGELGQLIPLVQGNVSLLFYINLTQNNAFDFNSTFTSSLKKNMKQNLQIGPIKNMSPRHLNITSVWPEVARSRILWRVQLT